ncbi:hypothetical protein V8C40DRAFT_279071 [Trichoderma camerunense]
MASCDRCEMIYAAIKWRRPYYDLELICGSGQRIPVHKIIVFSQSNVIEQTYYQQTKNEDCGHETCVISDYDFEDVQRLVDYLYTGDYKTTPLDSSEKQEKASELIIHGNLLGLAAKYNITRLILLAKQKSWRAIQGEPETRVLIQCIPKVYKSVIDPGRKIFNMMIESIRERIERTPPDRDTRNSLNFTMHEVPDFAIGLAMLFVKQ